VHCRFTLSWQICKNCWKAQTNSVIEDAFFRSHRLRYHWSSFHITYSPVYTWDYLTLFSMVCNLMDTKLKLFKQSINQSNECHNWIRSTQWQRIGLLFKFTAKAMKMKFSTKNAEYVSTATVPGHQESQVTMSARLVSGYSVYVTDDNLSHQHSKKNKN